MKWIVRHWRALVFGPGVLWFCVTGATKVNAVKPDVAVSANRYLKIQVAKERLSTTYLVVGRLEGATFQLLDSQRNLQVMAVTESQQTASASASAGSKRVLKPWDIAKLSLNFSMDKAQVQRCERLPEFQTFLNQLGLFKDLIDEFELTAGNKSQSPCAAKLVQLIAAQGYKVTLTYGRLEQAGISARAYVVGQERSKARSESGDSNSLGAESRSERRQLEIRFADGRVNDIAMNEDGFFVYSFQSQPLNAELRLFQGGQLLLTKRLANLPVFVLGESPLAVWGVQSASVVRGTFDAIAIETVPDSVLAKAVEESLKLDRAYRFSVALRPRYYVVKGSGLAGVQSGLAPLGVAAYNSLNQRFFLEAEALAPVNLLGDLPLMTRLSGTLNYWIFGEERRMGATKTSVRWGLGAGGYFFRQKPEKTATGSGEFVLTDVLGVVFGQVLVVPIGKIWEAKLRVDLSPIPSTQGYESSLSYFVDASLERCSPFYSCWGFGYRQEKIDVRIVGFGASTFESQGYGLVGYRYGFE